MTIPTSDRVATLDQPADRLANSQAEHDEPALIDGFPAANSPATWAYGIDWPIAIWIGVIHALAIAAPFFFTWQAIAVFVVLSFITGSLGVCMGYHRLLTHGSFKTFRFMRWTFAFLGGLSGEGSALSWVANHRKHHKYSDLEGDPHSPLHGPWWAHMFWFLPDWGHKLEQTLLDRYAPDLQKDPGIVLLHKLFLPSHFALGLALFAAGYYGQWMGLDGGWWSGTSLLLWGLGARMAYVMHVTWFVNSASHMWGYRNYDTTDNSRNLWWVAVLAFGEGWHNNHHAYQRVAAQGHKWWELDTTNWIICAMEKVGLVWDVVRLNDVRRTSPIA